MHQIPFLIIFLDALSYKIFVNDFKSFNNGFENLRYYKMLPAIGYSSNIHWLLFLGKTADKLGYFTDWNLIENNYKNKKNLCSLSPLNYLYNIRPLNDIVRFLKGKIGLNNNNIPITEKNIFINKSCYYFNCKKSRFIEAFGKLFYFLNIDNLSESIIKNKVKSLISRYNNIMLVSNKLDNIGHLKGPSSYEYEQSCIKLVNSIIYLLKELEYSYPLNFILLSDHGMSQIKAFIDILTPIYSKYGIPGNKYYLFCDSVYLRIWTRDKYLLENIKKYLDDLYEIRFIDEDKRKVLGISNKRFGDLIYVLREGYVFYPNFFQVVLRRFPIGMHGYLEDTDSNCGVLISNIDFGVKTVINPYDLYKEIISIIKR